MRQLLLAALALYKRWLSPLLPAACRYTPTCSEYATEAVARHGATAGLLLALWRLMRCQPFGGHGLDPVPPQLPWQQGQHLCEASTAPLGAGGGKCEHSSAATAAQIGIRP
jgi:hypothetical protein